MANQIYFQDTQQELAQVYRMWEKRYANTLQWRKTKARDPQWWDLAAEFSRKEGIPPHLLMYMASAYLNTRAEDAAVPFSANVMRSESLLYRSLANFRRRMNNAFQTMENLYILREGKELIAPKNTLEYARALAEYSCKYFEMILYVRTYEMRKNRMKVPDIAWDVLAYSLCDKHPFLLLRVARTPKVRAIAAVNCHVLCDIMPWHSSIWEGVAHPMSLSLPDQIAGLDVRQFYDEGQPCWCWPLTCTEDRPLFQMTDIQLYPSLYLSALPFCQKTELFLALKLEAARRGATDPLPDLS